MTFRTRSLSCVQHVVKITICFAIFLCAQQGYDFANAEEPKLNSALQNHGTHPFQTAIFDQKNQRTATPISLPVRLSKKTNDHSAPTDQHTIQIESQYLQQWIDGQYEVSMMRGNCIVQQANTKVIADQIVIWRMRSSKAGSPEQLSLYAEKITNDIKFIRPGQQKTFPRLMLKMVSRAGVSLQSVHTVTDSPASTDPFFQRGVQYRKDEIHPVAKTRELLTQTQFELPNVPAPQSGPPIGSVQLTPALQPRRHIMISPRSSTPYNLSSSLSQNSTPAEQVTIITGGVNFLVEGLEEVGKVDLTADSMVIWTLANQDGKFTSEMFQTADMPLQIYLEGNIEIRQGGNLIQATHAFYDVREERALMINGELTTYVPRLQGNLRMRASRIRQLQINQYQAQGVMFTGSHMGRPTYRLEAESVFFENRYPRLFSGGNPNQINPETNQPFGEPTPWITSNNTSLIIGNVPVLNLPRISGPANIQFMPIRGLKFGYDKVFGAQIESRWDLPQLLGWEKQEGIDWELLLNEYTDRGPAIGTVFDYRGPGIFGFTNNAYGNFEGIFQQDDGEDNLGADRRSLRPKDNQRGRVKWQYREMLPYNMALTSEFGFVSDRNFDEQYYEQQWDTQKDSDTLLELQQQYDNLTWSVLGQFQSNDFEHGTEWLPRGDLTLLSEPLLGGLLNWSTRSSLGYGRLNRADLPDDPANDVFTPLPYHPSASGLVAHTRHELNMPFNLGAVKVVPYVLGEAAYWGDDGFTGQSIDRLYGSAGARASLSFWKVMPYLRSSLFNLNGLAHKHTLSAEYYYADSSEDLNNIAQYNNFDDNAQERFRSRFLTNTFGGLLPGQFGPRGYAVRSGLGQSVSTPYNELVDDQHVVRVNSRHRLQTKVGSPATQNLRVQDWMTLDLGLSYFLNSNENNFGEDVGLFTAHYDWNIGARTRFLANAQYDFFDNAAELWDVGLLSQRSTRGSIYIGYRQFKGGPLDSRLITASTSYALSKKWIATLGAAYDVQQGRNQGQSLTITRAGPDFLMHVGASYDASRDNLGLSISIEPRIGGLGLNSTQLSSLLGTR